MLRLPLLLATIDLLLAGSSCQPGLEQQAKIKSDAGPRPELAGVMTYDGDYKPSGKLTRPKLTRALLTRGRERFEIHCSVCHGLTGNGSGIAVERGFPKPPDFDSSSSRAKSLEDFFETASRGQGSMYGFSHTLSREDLWAVVYYVRALQLRKGVKK